MLTALGMAGALWWLQSTPGEAPPTPLGAQAISEHAPPAAAAYPLPPDATYETGTVPFSSAVVPELPPSGANENSADKASLVINERDIDAKPRAKADVKAAEATTPAVVASAASAATAATTETVVPAAPPATPGVVQFAVSPWGHIDVDGQSVGTSPPLTRLTLAPGLHTITVRNADFPSYVETLLVSGDNPVTLRHRFGP